MNFTTLRKSFQRFNNSTPAGATKNQALTKKFASAFFFDVLTKALTFEGSPGKVFHFDNLIQQRPNPRILINEFHDPTEVIPEVH